MPPPFVHSLSLPPRADAAARYDRCSRVAPTSSRASRAVCAGVRNTGFSTKGPGFIAPSLVHLATALRALLRLCAPVVFRRVSARRAAGVGHGRRAHATALALAASGSPSLRAQFAACTHSL